MIRCCFLTLLSLSLLGCGDDDAMTVVDAGSDVGSAEDAGGGTDAGTDAGDPCATLDCGANGSCVAGACACDAGWTGERCEVDVDECAEDPMACHADATCTNTDGSFECACNEGYLGDGAMCAPTCAVDPCNDGVCTDGESGATCDCAGTGYEGAFCEMDVDECADGTDDCHADATCTNTDGAFTCACDDPFVGDGRTCACPEGTEGASCEDCAEGFHRRVSDGTCADEVRLSLVVTGDGAGTITIDGDPMVCRGSCEFLVGDGDTLTVQAMPTPTTRILGWSDAGAACSGTECAITIAGDTTIGLDWQLRHNIVFVTSTRTAPGAIGTLAAADTICADAAAAAGLHPSDWIAFLGTETATCPGETDPGCNPLDRLDASGARGWVNVAGDPVADTVMQLRDAAPWHAVRYDETGRGDRDREMATGMGFRLEPATGFTCTDYTVNSSDARVYFARSGGAARTMMSQAPNSQCSFAQGLLCFSTDHTDPLDAPTTTGRLAFLSETQWTPGGGIADADAVCQREACDAGLTGSADCEADPGTDRTFLAYLETDGVKAGERFDASGPDWVRADGMPWLTTDMLSIEETRRVITRSGLLLHADGSAVVGSPHAWSGAVNPTLGTCGDWTETTGQALFGTPENIFTHAAGGGRNCDLVARLYCLEE